MLTILVIQNIELYRMEDIGDIVEKGFSRNKNL